jgi:hypothetical protein
LNFARGSLIRLAATFTRAAQIFSVIENGASDGNVVAQSRRKQIAAKLGQVLTPTGLFGNCGGVSEIERGHDFEILFILRGGASRNLVEPLAYMRRVCAYELRKRVEEMVMSGASRHRYKAAHRESVNDRVVQVLVAKGLCNRDLAIGADGIARIALHQALRFRKRKTFERHAETVLCGGTNPRFRVYGSIQMIVQVAAFGHAYEKGP